MRDLVIIGSGPAGLSAAVYASNACMDFIVIEKYPMSGGQILNTEEVNNYLGFESAEGFTLGQTFRNHAEKSGATFVNDEVVSISKNKTHFEVKCENETYLSKAVILATGVTRKHLNVKGESEFAGKGVSYCATCDGNFFRNKTVAVVGGGDVACEDALYLANVCEKVYLIHRRDKLRAAKYLQNRVFDNNKIEFVPNANVTEINGGNAVESVLLDNGSTLSVNGIFIAIGVEPEVEFLNGLADTDSQGFIVANEDCKTSVDGLFVAGDIRTKPLRQISTAVSDGANAVKSAEDYFNRIDM